VTENDEQKLVVRHILRNGRRRYDSSSKARLVAECLSPGVSVSRLALDNGVNANLLRKWIKEAKGAGGARGAGPERGPPAFIPVVVEECCLSTGKAAARSATLCGTITSLVEGFCIPRLTCPGGSDSRI
jgi:transposase